MQLTVKRAPKSAVGNDIVHIHEDDRGCIPLNGVCKICVNGNKVYATVRGKGTADEILIDYQLRSRLGLELGKEYNFSIDYKWRYYLFAPLNATNMGVRAAYHIAIVSVLISVSPYLFKFVCSFFDI